LRDFGTFVRLAAAKHVFTIFDSCFAGTLFNVARSAPPPQITRLTVEPARQFLTSGDAGQKVSDDGTFARLFIEALKGQRRADANGDTYLTASELGAFLDARISNYTQNRQTPRFGALRDPRFDKGNFVFQLASTAPVRKATPRVPSGGATGGGSAEIVFWRSIEGSKDADSYRAYLDQYPTGSFAGLARLRIKQLNARKVAAITLPKDSTPSPATPAVGVYPAGRKAGDGFQDCSDCPEMVVISPGRFRMGDLNGGGHKNEKPVHDVRIGYGFAVGKYEVTRGEYAAFANATGRGTGNGCYYYTGSKWEKNRSKSWRDPGYSQTNRDPAVCVNWDDAQAYVSWLSRGTGQGYRLLSEAEWEYVARAGSGSKYSFGNSETELCANGNGADRRSSFGWRNNSCDDGYGERTAPVGSFSANGFGLYDVHGNVWEWVEDCWHETYNGAPTDGASWVSGGDCSRRVLRGGSWSSRPRLLRAADRNWNTTDIRSFSLGFRVARTLLQ
jgi:formylglycine-generating enzyme required for sulfatase activity